MSNCDHMDHSSEWESRSETEYRDNPDGSGRRQSKVTINYYCICSQWMKAEVQREWTNV